jgi:hypothetical protein
VFISGKPFNFGNSGDVGNFPPPSGFQLPNYQLTQLPNFPPLPPYSLVSRFWFGDSGNPKFTL